MNNELINHSVMNLYAVRDDLGATYGKLVEFSTDEAAIQSFSELYKRGSLTSPDKYSLYFIGTVERKTHKVFDEVNMISYVPSIRLTYEFPRLIYNYTAYKAHSKNSNEEELKEEESCS